jgi:hypothetical protein
MKGYVKTLAIVGLIAIGLWLIVPRGQKTHLTVQATSIEPTSISDSHSTKLDTLPSSTSQSVVNSHSTTSEAIRQYMQDKAADPQWDWKQSINFWGMVLDESNNPVAEASVHFVWNDLSANGTSEADTTSDAEGLFSLTGKVGKGLSVYVKKDGYYNSKSSVGSFEYANPANGLFIPDPTRPVIFHLRKKGHEVDLVTSAYGMRYNFPVHIPIDGTPVKIDLMQRKAGDEGQLQLSEIKPDHADWQQATNWAFEIEIPSGGLVGENDEFPFEAPTIGYQPVVECQFRKDVNWTWNLKTNFYIKFSNPPLYGHLQIQTGISYGGAFLTYAINPTGSRNLEPK